MVYDLLILHPFVRFELREELVEVLDGRITTRSIAFDVLRHRIILSYEAEAEDKTSETVIQKIFNELPVP